MEATEHNALRQRISRAAEKGTLSHAVIFSGEGDRMALARYWAAAKQCQNAQRPCLQCQHCRKVMEDIHPDVIWVRDDEHKTLPVESVRQMRKDVFIRPNEGRAKIYIFPESRQLDARNQDVLLKIVEEGPAYAGFVFCAENSATLLQTIRSRCVEYKLGGQQGDTDRQDAVPLCALLLRRDRTGAAEYLMNMEKEKRSREELSAFLGNVRQLLGEVLLKQSGAAIAPVELEQLPQCRLTRRELMGLTDLLQQAQLQCEYNIGTGHLLGSLSAQLDQALA